MMHQFPPSSVSAKLVAINSAVAFVALRETAAVAEDDPVEKKGYSESSGSVEKEVPLLLEYSDTLMKPDVGILSKNFKKTNGREQPIGKNFAIHRKKQAAAVDVDVGILDKRRRNEVKWRQQQKPFDTNLHAMNEVTLRSLQSEEVLPKMCPGKYGGGASFFNLFDKTDGYFPKCTCPSPTTCGPVLCECLELDADGDIFQCMDPLEQLCEGTKYIEGIPGPWSMKEYLGSKYGAIRYCSYLPCFADGGSRWQCQCQFYDSLCTEYRNKLSCATSKCCQAQTDDEGRYACIYEGYENYYDQVTSLYISDEEMTSRFNECSFNSGDDKSIVECYCESFSYRLCVNYGVLYSPELCEAMNCCWEQTEDDARLDCFTTRFRHGTTGYQFHRLRDELQDSCVANGRSSDQCKCDIQGLANCVYGIDLYNSELVVWYKWEPRCDLFQCCQSQTGDTDEGRKDCLVQDDQDEAQLIYEACIKYGYTTEYCYCYKSNTLCSSGHSIDVNCELSSCCQDQADDTGRRECIGNFTTSQPSSAPSSEILTHTDTSPASSPSTGDQVLEDSATSSTLNSSNCLLESKKVRKALVVTAVIGWLLIT